MSDRGGSVGEGEERERERESTHMSYGYIYIYVNKWLLFLEKYSTHGHDSFVFIRQMYCEGKKIKACTCTCLS